MYTIGMNVKARSKVPSSQVLRARELRAEKRKAERDGAAKVNVPHGERINFLCIRRDQNKGRYEDVFRVLERLTPTFGSVTNALIQLVRTSPHYTSAVRGLRTD